MFSAVLPKKSMLRRMLEKGVQIIDLRRIQDASLQSNEVKMKALMKINADPKVIKIVFGDYALEAHPVTED